MAVWFKFTQSTGYETSGDGLILYWCQSITKNPFGCF